MQFRPLHDRVVVRRIEAEEKTKGGIIIPDTAKEKPQEGEVIAAGPGARDESGKLVPLDVKAGDRILFGKWSGTEVRIDGEDLLIMKEYATSHGRRRADGRPQEGRVISAIQSIKRTGGKLMAGLRNDGTDLRRDRGRQFHREGVLPWESIKVSDDLLCDFPGRRKLSVVEQGLRFRIGVPVL